MKWLWEKKGIHEASEQRLADQARAIKTNEWLTDMEIEEIKRAIEQNSNPTTSEEAQITENEESENLIMREDINQHETGPNNNHRISKNVQYQREYQRNINVNKNELGEEENLILRMLQQKLEIIEKFKHVNLRYDDRKVVKDKTKRVDSVTGKIETQDISKTNSLLMAAACVVASLTQNDKKRKQNRQNEEPWWKRRMKKDIKQLKSDMNQWKCGWLTSSFWKQKLESKYHVYQEGFSTVIEELKQRVKAKETKLRRYEERNDQFHQNRLFAKNQKLLFERIEGMKRQHDLEPDVSETVKFWSDIWSNDSEHNDKAEWLRKIEDRCKDVKQQNEIKITEEDFQKQMGKNIKLESNREQWFIRILDKKYQMSARKNSPTIK